MKEVKRFYRYLKGTLDFGLWYPKIKDFTLTAYIDSNSDGRVDDRKSTSGVSFFLGKCLLSWLSKNNPLYHYLH
jgi:hypothetical protein